MGGLPQFYRREARRVLRPGAKPVPAAVPLVLAALPALPLPVAFAGEGDTWACPITLP